MWPVHTYEEVPHVANMCEASKSGTCKGLGVRTSALVNSFTHKFVYAYIDLDVILLLSRLCYLCIMG